MSVGHPPIHTHTRTPPLPFLHLVGRSTNRCSIKFQTKLSFYGRVKKEELDHHELELQAEGGLVRRPHHPPLRAMPGQSAFLQDGQVGEIMCLGKGVQRSSLEDLFDHPSKC